MQAAQSHLRGGGLKVLILIGGSMNDCTFYVAKTNALIRCSLSAPLFSHMNKSGFVLLPIQ